jgi:hypothetical protein
MTDNAQDELRDRFAVLDLVTQFHRSVDFKDFGLLASIVTDDVAWVWSATHPEGSAADGAQGRDAVVAWLEAATRTATPHHHTTNHLVHLHGDEATTESYMFVADKFSLRTLAIGIIETSARRSADGWRLSRIKVDEQIGRAFTSPNNASS